MNQDRDNRQDSHYTGREANRDNKKGGYRQEGNRSYSGRSDNRRYDDNRSRGGERRGGYDNRRSYSQRDDRGSSYRRDGGEGYRTDRPYSDRRDTRRSGNDERRSSYGNSRGGYNPNYQRDNDRRSTYNRSDSRRSNYSSDRSERGERGGYQSSEDRRGAYRSNNYNRRDSYRSEGNRNRPYSRPYSERTEDYNPHAKYSKRKQIEYQQKHVDPNEPIRLNKYLANAGVCSRREADELIESGQVTVDGEIVLELGTKVKRSAEVLVDGKPVSIEKKVYVLLNKPKDCVTTMDDPQERQTVMDFVQGACEERIYPVGRLDRKTTGVLLLTNDGDLAAKLTHPKYDKKKIYHVVTDRNVTLADLEKIAEGIELDDGLIQADSVGYIDDAKRNQIGIEIHSGRNRIVRRIFESLGYRVVKLDRVLFAGLTKKGLRRGQWRYLTAAEVGFLNMGSFE